MSACHLGVSLPPLVIVIRASFLCDHPSPLQPSLGPRGHSAPTPAPGCGCLCPLSPCHCCEWGSQSLSAPRARWDRRGATELGSMASALTRRACPGSRPLELPGGRCHLESQRTALCPAGLGPLTENFRFPATRAWSSFALKSTPRTAFRTRAHLLPEAMGRGQCWGSCGAQTPRDPVSRPPMCPLSPRRWAHTADWAWGGGCAPGHTSGGVAHWEPTPASKQLLALLWVARTETLQLGKRGGLCGLGSGPPDWEPRGLGKGWLQGHLWGWGGPGPGQALQAPRATCHTSCSPR